MDVPGAKLGHYELRSLVATGARSSIYRARDSVLSRDVALKVLHAHVEADPVQVERFSAEARNAVALRHPNVIQVYEFGLHDGHRFLTMELVDGRSMAGFPPLDPPHAVDLLRQAARGLSAAWAAGLVHRDVKPSHLLLDRQGLLKVTDFWLGRNLRGAKRAPPSLVVGTPRYMAPETVLGRPLDRRSDLYSLGATFYHLLTGVPPFDGPDDRTVLELQVHESAPPLRTHRPDLPEPLCAAVERLLAKRPEARFQDCDELDEALAAVGS